MREFKAWWDENANDYCDEGGMYYEECAEDAWKAVLEWYQKTAAKCEKDCSTDEDYKVLYFHLKQVLKNEIDK